MTTHLCGAGMGFVGFSVSLVIGLWADNSYITVVSRALGVMFVFYVIGCILAVLGQKVIQENFDDEVKRLASEMPEDFGDVVPVDEGEELPENLRQPEEGVEQAKEVPAEPQPVSTP